jgi:hypothetical protein
VTKTGAGGSTGTRVDLRTAERRTWRDADARTARRDKPDGPPMTVIDGACGHRANPKSRTVGTTDVRPVLAGDSEAITPDRHLEPAAGEPRDFVGRPGNLQAWDPEDSHAV